MAVNVEFRFSTFVAAMSDQQGGHAMGLYRKLSNEQVAKMKRLIKEFPNLTNEQIGQLVGCSDSTVGAERRGTRAPQQAAKAAAFEAARRALGGALPSMEDDDVAGGQEARESGGQPRISPKSRAFSSPSIDETWMRTPVWRRAQAEKTAAQVEAEIVKKAALAVNVAQAMLKSASDSAIEDQATILMSLADEDLIATYKALAAVEDDGDQP